MAEQSSVSPRPDVPRALEHIWHVVFVAGLALGVALTDGGPKWALFTGVVLVTACYSAWLYASRRLTAVQYELIDAYKEGEALHEATLAELRRYRRAFAYAAAQKAQRAHQAAPQEVDRG